MPIPKTLWGSQSWLSSWACGPPKGMKTHRSIVGQVGQPAADWESASRHAQRLFKRLRWAFDRAAGFQAGAKNRWDRPSSSVVCQASQETDDVNRSSVLPPAPQSGIAAAEADMASSDRRIRNPPQVRQPAPQSASASWSKGFRGDPRRLASSFILETTVASPSTGQRPLRQVIARKAVLTKWVKCGSVEKSIDSDACERWPKRTAVFRFIERENLIRRPGAPRTSAADRPGGLSHIAIDVSYAA
jgi:hypothetical protein